MATFEQIRSKFPSARGLSDNEIVDKLSSLTKLPYEDVAQRFGFTEKTSTGFLGGANDLVIEAGNAAAGLVSGVGEFVSPGNRFSRAIQQNIIDPGEAKQSIPTALAKRALQRGMSTSELGPQASAVYDYITENPGLAAAQAVGSFGPIGLAGKATQAGSLAVGLGSKAAGRVGLGATAAISGAAAGGDAGGDAYKLVMDTPREVLLAHPQAQALVEAGVTDVGQIYEELATRAARRASVVPAVIGAVSGATGAEKALLGGTRGFRGVAKSTGAEALGEGLEESATTFSGRKSAQEYNPAIDPMVGVYGSGLMGAALGAGTALPVSLARMQGEQNQEVDLTTPTAEQTVDQTAAPAPQGLSTYRPAPLPDSAFTQPSAQRDLFNQVGGVAPEAPVAGEQLDLFGGGGQLPTVDERQGDLFAPQEPTFQTRITAGLLDGLGLPRQSSMYRQLLNKDMADPEQQPQIAELFDRVRSDANISERTKSGVEGLAMQAFGSLAQQQAMFGPRGGAYPQGIPSTAQAAPGPIENILPTAPLGATAAAPAAAPAVEVSAPVAPTAQAPAQPAALPTVPAGVTLNADENRLVKQANALFGIAETDAERTSVAAMVQRTIDRAVQRSGTPVTPVGASNAVAAALPAAQPAAGVSSTPTTGAPSGTQAPQTVKAKTQRAKAPAAPAAAVVEDTAPKNVSEAIKEDNDIDRVLKAVEAEDDKADKLFASVTGDTKKAPGKPSLPTQVYAAIRNAILNPGKAVIVRKAKSVEKDAAATEKYGAKAKRIAEAATEFAAAYETYASQNLVRPDKVTKRTETADDVVAANATRLKEKAAAVQRALAKLGEAVDGNAKDVEAVVRFVKDRAQKEKKGDPKAEKADITLSRAWTAAKSESFIGEPDLLATTGKEVRQSSEATARGATPQLVDAATNGYATFGREKAGVGLEKGLNGILNYIRTVGTPFEKTLAQAIKLAVAGKAPINIKFVKDGVSQYDPKSNTITINETSSKEVALHEALHGALQWFVYTNPNAAQVVALKTALQRVVNYDGKLPPKAAEVQALLKKILAGKSKTAELDAVLELVSYGNTLNDFRRALQGMESNAPRTFTKFANDVMDAIYALVRRMLGSSQTVASDVMENTFQLLEAARAATQDTAPAKGNVLKAEVTSNNALATPVDSADASAFAKGPGAFKTPTQIAFELIGFGRVNGKDLPLTAKLKENGAKVAEWVRVNAPTLERVTLNFNSKFSNGGLVNSAIETFKFDQNTGYLQMERISQHLYAHPELAKPFLAYMDGDSKALDGVKNNASMKAIADNLRGLMTKYIQSLPANSKERRAFDNVPFSQYLLHPDSIGQTTGTTMGVAKIGDLLKTETRSEISIDEFKKYLSERDGSIDLNDPLYQMSENTFDGVRPAGFISKAKYEEMGAAPNGMTVDTSRVWKFAKYDPEKGPYTFESSSSAKQLAEGRKIEELSAALLNTTAALSHTYASRNFFNGLLTIGRDESGNPTANSVAFDTVEQVNAAFTGRKISEKNVLRVSDEASRSPQIRLKTQRTGTWVQLPENSPTYGVLQGKIIPGPVWNSMLDMHDRSPLLNSRIINGVMTAFKKSKTVYNPGTHVTNVLSNVSLAILHGINFSTLGRATKMFVQFERNPNSMSKEDLALMKAFYNSGAVLGQFSSSEIKQTVYDKMNAAIEPDSDNSYMTRIKTFMKYEAAKAKLKEYDSVATEFYAAEDNVFRLAAFLNTAGNIQLRDGTSRLSEQQMVESGAAARNMFLDYDIDARAIRALRQSFLPFVSWPYAAAGVLGRLAIEKPWAVTNMLMSVALIAAATGGAEDEEDRKNAPKYIREKSLMGLGPHMHIRVPFMGDEQNPVYFNLGKYVPMISLFQSAPGEQKTFGVELPGFATPGGPFINTISALTGYDPFTSKPIAAPTDETWDRMVKAGKYVYDTMAPTLAGTKFWSQVGDLKDETTGPLGVEKSPLFLARNIGGLGLYQFNTEESRFMQDKQVDKIKKDFATAMSKAKREEYRKGYPDYEALDAELDDLQVRLEKRITELRGEE